MRVKPFRGLRPPKTLVEAVTSRPYDVLDTAEARAEAGDNELSLYHIIKPEIDFPAGTDEHDEAVYRRGAENLAHFRREGWLVQDAAEHYYIYAQTMDGRTQYGIVLCAAVEDYMTGRIKKHELTRRDKEEDRMRHVRIQNANVEPVFFAYPDDAELERLVSACVEGTAPEYDFVAPDGTGHRLWILSAADIDKVTERFAAMPAMYIADGHHRSAAAALVGAERRQANVHHRGDEEYNFFMAVCFPAGQLKIMDYNRVVKDLNGLTEEEFLDRLNRSFHVEAKGTTPYKPVRLHTFGLYVGGKWYALTARAEATACGKSDDLTAGLDVTLSSRLILDEILGIKDLRTDRRVDFVGGIRGLSELQRRVDSGEMRVALALCPVTMDQLMAIADAGGIMPPKTTWFEPKLRSGLVVHTID
jgi:uncharacterized protein (DUF1015 family)